jgi:hypothetical protein
MPPASYLPFHSFSSPVIVFSHVLNCHYRICDCLLACRLLHHSQTPFPIGVSCCGLAYLAGRPVLPSLPPAAHFRGVFSAGDPEGNSVAIARKSTTSLHPHVLFHVEGRQPSAYYPQKEVSRNVTVPQTISECPPESFHTIRR